MRTSARVGVTGILAAVGLISLGELAGQLLLADPVTPQRLAVLAVAVLAAVAAGCVAAAVRVDRTPAAVPVVRRVTALRDKSWRVAFLRLRDPGARGRSRPRAPSAAPAVAWQRLPGPASPCLASGLVFTVPGIRPHAGYRRDDLRSSG